MTLPPRDDAGAEPSAATARRRMSLSNDGSARQRRLPNAGEIARRRRMLRWAKWALPAGALLLLGSIAAWPELDRSMNAARVGVAQASKVRIESGQMLGARYRGLDGHDRPFTITATSARQAGQTQTGDRVDLTGPIADTLEQGGGWIRISAANGVYMQHGQQLDLDRDVMLYRDDGVIMTGPVADIDLKRGVVASNRWVHAEGPFGQLDAQSYLMSQHDGIGQFRGPARLVLNDDHIARAAAAPTPHRTASTGDGAAR